MKKILFITYIIIFHTFANADDARDFEIEGMSAGDSLLNYLEKWNITEQQIIDTKKFYYPASKKFYGLQFDLTDYETYKHIQVHIKSGSNYTVSSVVGGEFFDNINKCYSKQKIIVSDLKKAFPKAELSEYKSTYPDDPNSSIKITEFYLNNFDVVVYCTDWSIKAESRGNTDNLRVEISSLEFSKFISTEAY